jgi:hypothetical protein
VLATAGNRLFVYALAGTHGRVDAVLASTSNNYELRLFTFILGEIWLLGKNGLTLWRVLDHFTISKIFKFIINAIFDFRI